uniref:Uncharacterized protein n=1 Tax=Ceratitis capitata TaxID=7213 RepID=W8C8Z9_CERCA
MQIFTQTLCMLSVLHSGLFIAHTSASYPQVLDIQLVAHNHTQLPESIAINKGFQDCDAMCQALDNLHVESDIVKLSSLTVQASASTMYEWQLMGLYKIIFTMMQLKYLRQPVPM